jgi:hypothetical protein
MQLVAKAELGTTAGLNRRTRSDVFQALTTLNNRARARHARGFITKIKFHTSEMMKEYCWDHVVHNGERQFIFAQNRSGKLLSDSRHHEKYGCNFSQFEISGGSAGMLSWFYCE